ncbi:endonuclease/exonuclease/phosphatase family protein [Puteibacter caeruleilacunae]|nr:endonuclease/exonuclease/phosphatase family protein [Puteibacter caeruleilacunae]
MNFRICLTSVLLIASLLFSACDSREAREIKVLQFNIWQEGTVVPGGFDALVDEVIASDADFVTFSEVRNYNHTRFNERVVKALADKGATYYSFFSDDTGLLSRYPIKDSSVVFPLNNDHGTIHRLTTEIDDQEFSVYTAHLDYLNCTYYEVFGYNGNTWKEQAPLLDVDSIIYRNNLSQRDDAIKAFVAAADKDISAGRIVILGGDFNEPSLLDWTDVCKYERDHNGVSVEWPVSKILLDKGYRDTYRECHPNPITHPGYTYPGNCESVPVKKLSWAPKADERERIDFIYYYPNEALTLKASKIVGPNGSICRNKRVANDSSDEIIPPVGIWPSDHKGVLSIFELK